jgi:hypothetical protein
MASVAALDLKKPVWLDRGSESIVTVDKVVDIIAAQPLRSRLHVLSSDEHSEALHLSTFPSKQLLGTLHLSTISRKRIRTHRSNTDPTHQEVGIRYYSKPILTNTKYTSLRFRGDVFPHSVHQPCCGRVGSYARRPPVAIKSERLHHCRVLHFSNTPGIRIRGYATLSEGQLEGYTKLSKPYTATEYGKSYATT